MVSIEEMEVSEEEEQKKPSASEEKKDEESLSDERLKDAEAIEEAASSMARESARTHLMELVKRLRSESAAMKRAEESRAKAESMTVETPAVAAAPEAAGVVEMAAAPPPVVSSNKFMPIDKFAFDDGGYNSAHVTLYITDMPGIGKIKSQVSCDFTTESFDLVIRDYNGKSYRLFKDNLDKDIDPKTSKCVVKSDRIIVKLGKVKSEYGSYDYWSGLTAKGGKKKDTAKSKDPSASIMELMKEMYESGDDNTRKMIGETMLKQRRGELGKDGPGGMDDL